MVLPPYAAFSEPLKPQILHADVSLQHSQTFSRSIRFGILMKIVFMVMVIGFPRDQAILLNVADADSLNSGV